MHAWAPYPFVRLTLAWIAGILLARLFPEVPGALPLWVPGAGLLLLITLQWLSRASYYFRLWSPVMGMLSLLLIMILAGWRYQEVDESTADRHLLHVSGVYRHTLVAVTEAPVQREKSWRMLARVQGIRDSTGWKEAEGKLLLYLPLADSLLPQYGDRYVLQGLPERVPGPMNPGEFDYAGYLADQQIYHRYFARAATYHLFDRGNGTGWKETLIALRQHCEALLDHAIRSPRERAILQALVLGDKSSLDGDTREDYARAGALHILAVSGLHLGIFYTLLILLFGGLQKSRAGSVVLLLISLAAIWGYALLTGLSPSVFRAAVMFSFIALARAVQLQGNIYNTLALSAFLLLLIDPFLMLSVGFQLSYVAVLGIVYGFPRVYGVFSIKNRLLDYAWQISAVSIVAQLATLPLSLYYFGQFPTYFLLSNLLVIPAATVMLCGGLLVLISGFLPLLSEALGWLLGWIMYGFNEAIALLQYLPGNLLQGLYIDWKQSILLYLTALAVILLLRRRRFRYAGYAFAMVATVLVLQAWNWHAQEVKSQWIIHHSSKGLAIQHIRGHHSTIWLDSVLFGSTNLDYQVLAAGNRANTETHLRVLDSSNSRQWAYGRLLAPAGRQVLSLEKTFPKDISSSELKIDMVLLSKACKNSIADIRQMVQPELIVLDASHSRAFAERRLEEAKQLGIPCYSISLQGALVIGE